MAFKLTKYSYKSLRKMSVQDRLAAVQDKEMGQWLLSLLTPSQFVELFPDYYRRSLPDISGFTRAMPSSMTIAKQAAVEEQIRNTTTGAAAGANFKAGGWRKKWQEGIAEQQRAIPTRAGVVPPAQLSPEQRKSFDDLRTSPMAADDPRAKMFAGMSAEQLAKVRISKYKEGDKEYFKYSAPDPSEEEVKQYNASGSRGGNAFFNSIIKAEGTSKYGDPYETSLGYMKSPKPLTQMTMAESLQWGETVKKSQGLNSSAKGAFQIVNTTQRDAMRALNIGMDEKFTPENQRRMAAWIVQNQGLGAWEGLKIHKDQWQAAEAAMAQGLHRQYTDPITNDYSARSMQLARESLIRQQEEKIIGNLAAFTTANMPISTAGGLNPTPGTAPLIGSAETKGDAISHMMRIVNKQEHSPEDKALIKEFLQKGGHGLDPEQYAWCAATVGSALRQAGIRDIPAVEGGNVATSYLNWGRGIDTSKESVARGDVIVLARGKGAGEVGGHVAMATGEVRRNASGQLEVQVVEGNKSDKGNLGWYTIGEQGMQIRRAREGVEVAAAPTVQGVPPSQPSVMPPPDTMPRPETGKPPIPAPYQQAPQVETPEVLNKPGAQTATVTQPGPEKYKVDVPKFLGAIKQTPDFKSNPLSWMATDSMIMSGFNDDARVKAAGVYLDDKGVMHFKKGMTPEVKQVMADFDTKSFMSKIEEKKPDVKPVSNPPVPTPAQPAAQIETPKVEPREAPTKVKTNASGGDNKVNTEQISAYPIGGLKGDNVVVVNKQQQPLFTMNTNESVTMNPNTDMATVSPNTKERRIGEANRTSPLEGMFDKFNQSVRELSSRFDQNKPVPQQKERPEVFQPEGGSWINNLNKLTESQFHNPTARRAFYRSGGVETGEPNSGFHYSHGNKS